MTFNLIDLLNLPRLSGLQELALIGYLFSPALGVIAACYFILDEK